MLDLVLLFYAAQPEYSNYTRNQNDTGHHSYEHSINVYVIFIFIYEPLWMAWGSTREPRCFTLEKLEKETAQQYRDAVAARGNSPAV